jgi:hypothetical protein
MKMMKRAKRDESGDKIGTYTKTAPEEEWKNQKFYKKK